jgi:hypothetical protein
MRSLPFVVSLSTSLAMIAVAIGNPFVCLWCLPILAFIVVLELVIPTPTPVNPAAQTVMHPLPHQGELKAF